MTPAELKTLRLQAELTQAQLAAKLGVQLTTVARWEQGQNRITEPMARLVRFTLGKEGRRRTADERRRTEDRNDGG